jgi:hypothetical protein
MKSLLLVAGIVIVATGCASDPYGTKSELRVQKKVHAMSRQEVINGITDCEAAGTRPIIIMSKRRIDEYYSDVIVDVTCAPRTIQYYK